MAYAVSTPMVSRRALVFVGIVLLHVGFVWTLNAGLATQAVEVVFGPIETKMIEEPKNEEEKPPPPPPKIETTPPPFVPPPDVAIELPAENTGTAITNVTTTKPVAKPPPPPPPVNRVAPKANPRRPPTKPDYPPQSMRLGEEGNTVLKLCVSDEGKVTSAEVAKSSGFQRLDDAAVKHALRAWRFLPGTENGKPVPMCTEFRVVWKIENER